MLNCAKHDIGVGKSTLEIAVHRAGNDVWPPPSAGTRRKIALMNMNPSTAIAVRLLSGQ